MSTDDNNSGGSRHEVPDQQHPPPRKCPRCDSNNTKFCYYNNYSHSQPRYFCKACRRYWTHGGTLRNVPVGGGCRKNKRARTSLSAAVASNEIAASQRLVPAAALGRIPGAALRTVIPPVGNFLYSGGINQTTPFNYGGGGGDQFGGNLLGLPTVKAHQAARLFPAPVSSAFPPIPPRSLSSWAHRLEGGGGSSSSAAERAGYWGCGGEPAGANQLSENHPGVNPSQ